MTGSPLDPRAYPWSEPLRVGILRPGGVVEDDPGFLVGDATEALRGRTPVVAVGSNAASAVLARKLGASLSSGLPMGTATVDGLHVGHSAHVSAGGYVAAAPARGVSARQVTVCWFDPAQLTRLDASEPNYRRVPLPESMPCRSVLPPGPAGRSGPSAWHGKGPLVPGPQIYRSVHGVLGEAGRVLALRAQTGVLAWLAARLPPDLGDRLRHDRLVEPHLRERVRRALVDTGLVLPSALGPPGLG